jgi:peptidoglycan/LPS O-acetylase OafA/YrhL
MFGGNHRREPDMFVLACIVFAIVIVALVLECGRITANYAAHRGRSWRTWFVLGALSFPLFPLLSIVLALLPSYRRENAISR